MRDEEFEALAHRYGQMARTDPRRYAWRIAGLTALGYGYVIGALLLLVVANVALAVVLLRLHALALAGKLIIVQLAVAWGVLRTLWVRVTPAPGIVVSRAEAPALFAAVDQVRAGIHSRPVHRVLITDELNASLEQYPRLGVFGWWRNHLLLGLPLLRGIGTDEARAVIAHELAHLSHEHARSGLWSVRVKLTWTRLYEAYTRGQTHGAWLFRRFANWYVPRMEAATRARKRAQEHEADVLAARVAGAPAAARALTRLELLAHLSDTVVWPQFTAQADHQPQPPAGWVSALCRDLSSARAEGTAMEVLAREMEAPDDPYATHPPLGARLRAMGIGEIPADALEPVGRSAASELLGPLAERLAGEFDRRWLNAATPAWTQRYEKSQEEMRRLAELDAAAAAESLAPIQEMERACLVLSWRTPDEARALFAAIADQLPRARAAFGQMLLQSGDEAGIEHLRLAGREDPSLALATTLDIANYLERAGRTDEAAEYRRRAQAEAHEDAAAQDERRRITLSTAVQAHTLAPEQVRELARAAAADPLVRRARLVRRVVKHRPHKPAHLLVLELARFRLITADRRKQAVRTVAQRIETVAGVWVVTDQLARMGKKARAVPGSLVYDRDVPAPP